MRRRVSERADLMTVAVREGVRSPASSRHAGPSRLRERPAERRAPIALDRELREAARNAAALMLAMAEPMEHARGRPPGKAAVVGVGHGVEGGTRA